ncbi:nuclear speckle splicing regulatory protein 1-like [Rhodnius prolixus]|uniref:Nuclear speckle splicing regulatory protein 1 N-terminal domain-containing protein n=3 Tax=Rhodnius TaxID=13248 RepID=R4FP02_RHOPR
MSSKQYGLQLTKKNNQYKVTKHAAFGDDSDSDKSDGGADWVKKSLKREPTQSLVKKQTKLDLQRALEQDSTVFQYDEIYEQLEQQRQGKSVKEKDRKPKYIQKLMVSAEKRKIENERRIERQVQKERENEGDEFKDKETFVTSAYKKKLEEFAKLDAEQKRQDMLEEIGDVTKQQDISGFYRHLYQTTVSPKEDSIPKSSDKESKTVEKELKEKSKECKKDRHYRKRKNSESSADKDKDTEISSSSSSSSSSESGSEEEKSSESETEDPKRIRLKEYSTKTETPVEVKVEESTSVQEDKQPEAVPEISIWEKRTVGLVFEAALKRYIERKNARLTAVH